MKYLLIVDWTSNDVIVIRNIPDNLWDEENEEPDEQAVIDFLWEKLHCFVDDIQWSILDEDSTLSYYTCQEDGTVKNDAVDYFAQHF